MLTTLILLALGTPSEPAPSPVADRFEVALAPCARSTVLRTTWASDRRATVRADAAGAPVAERATRTERRLDRDLEVLDCRSGIPQKLRVRYGEAFERRYGSASGAEAAADAPAPIVLRSPLANRSFDVVQFGELAQVTTSEGATIAPSLAQTVLDAECIFGGAVPQPGDDVARALGGSPREKGETFELDGQVALALLGGREVGACAATCTFLGVERSAEGLVRARFDVRLLVHEEREGGRARDADLAGRLLADPRTGRPFAFEVDGAEVALGAPAESEARFVESTGTWSVRRTWEWR